jgi:hypothetical protein
VGSAFYRAKILMKKYIMPLVMGMMLCAPYGLLFYAWFNVSQLKNQWVQQQAILQADVEKFQNKEKINGLWRAGQSKIHCDPGKTTINKSMVNILSGLKKKSIEVKSVSHKKNNINIAAQMSSQDLLYWLLSLSFQKSCLMPLTIQAQRSSNIPMMHLHLTQDSYDKKH